ncbi:hypothetical protein AFR_03770 [Actinoplanes friuliensis DSM 7358]|uniref:Uncharacterized protein n=1 Tax=Actinoplanes friuliensis DSM 7358 TaxID=1246995 RepID=U5VQ51_9ACTN|nr:hypothetical protein AFR_03770 [Actinoplanes friuliensis DSM 7358]
MPAVATVRAVSSPIHHLTVIRYFRDGRHWESTDILSPSWPDVVTAIERMDDFCYPIVQLNCTADEEDETIFNVIGGDGSYALFHQMGEWEYTDPNGSDEEVRLWQSDQGYFCKRRNVLTDLDEVLRLTRIFYETGSYESLA